MIDKEEIEKRISYYKAYSAVGGQELSSWMVDELRKCDESLQTQEELVDHVYAYYGLKRNI